MRQFGDALVWMAMIVVVVAVVYFTPRVAKYVAAKEVDRPGEGMTSHDIAYHQNDARMPAR